MLKSIPSTAFVKFEALRLYEVEHMWKLKFNSYKEQGNYQNLNLKVYTKKGICRNFEAEAYRK